MILIKPCLIYKLKLSKVLPEEMRELHILKARVSLPWLLAFKLNNRPWIWNVCIPFECLGIIGLGIIIFLANIGYSFKSDYRLDWVKLDWSASGRRGLGRWTHTERGNSSVYGSQPAKDQIRRSICRLQCLGHTGLSEYMKSIKEKAKNPLFRGLGIKCMWYLGPHIILETSDPSLIPFYYNYKSFSPLHIVMGWTVSPKWQVYI